MTAICNSGTLSIRDNNDIKSTTLKLNNYDGSITLQLTQENLADSDPLIIPYKVMNRLLVIWYNMV